MRRWSVSLKYMRWPSGENAGPFETMKPVSASVHWPSADRHQRQPRGSTSRRSDVPSQIRPHRSTLPSLYDTSRRPPSGSTRCASSPVRVSRRDNPDRSVMRSEPGCLLRSKAPSGVRALSFFTAWSRESVSKSVQLRRQEVQPVQRCFEWLPQGGFTQGVPACNCDCWLHSSTPRQTSCSGLGVPALQASLHAKRSATRKNRGSWRRIISLQHRRIAVPWRRKKAETVAGRRPDA